MTDRDTGGSLLPLLKDYKRSTPNNTDESFWGDLFYSAFINNEKFRRGSDDDDLLFYVRHLPPNSSADKLLVARRNSPSLPSGTDPHYHWEETVCLNVLLHIEYSLSMSVYRRGSDKQPVILRKTLKRVFALPYGQRRLDVKESEVTLSYPFIYFSVDDYEECWRDIILEEGDNLHVQVDSVDPASGSRSVIFQSSASYEAVQSLIIEKKNKLSFLWNSSSIHFLTLTGIVGEGQTQICATLLDSGAEKSTGVFDKWLKKNSQSMRMAVTFVSVKWQTILEQILSAS
eukprot:TRINITY_DN10599_c0_g1_i1.p1 TRINITY_DN10599_c0_g1~~TRINITY_DN10599_c0_g1_i1.p1  ORF type:complete len:287 (-),score=33.16 TRINITY_DN10599_c0_g1_i1:58-918(-)